MASIIRLIAFKNFYSFYGDYSENTYYFSEGLNIINADNGMGKSKMFNGFLWILKDMVYDADTRENDGVMHSALKLLSNKAQREEMTPEAGVRIEFEDAQSYYTVTKSIKFQRVSQSANPEEESSWNVPNQVVSVEERDKVTNSVKVVYDVNKQEDIIKNRLISRALQSYSLLQGEAIDNIVDLSKSGNLSQTIETLTDLSALNAIEKSCKNLVKYADSELTSKQQQCSINHSEFIRVSNDKESYVKQISQCEESIENYKNELQIATETKEKLEAQIANTENRVKFKQQINQLEAAIQDKENEYAKHQSEINDSLFKKPLPWILLGTKGLVSKFYEARDNYTQTMFAKKATADPETYLGAILPEGSPDDASLDKMLTECRCFVCNRPFSKDDEYYSHVEMLRNCSRQAMKKKEDKFQTFFGEMQMAVSPYMKVDDAIYGQIADSRKKTKAFEADLKKLRDQLTDARAEYFNYGGSASSDGVSDTNRIAEYNKATNDIHNLNGYITSAQKRLDELKAKVADCDKKMAEYGGAAVPQAYRDMKEVMTDVRDIFLATKKRIYDEVLNSLEKKSNEFYEQLTSGSNISGGKLVFTKTDFDTIQLKVVTPTGGEFTGASEGFQRMKKIAVVMAIISSKFGGGHFDYPFIADAPFSAFGRNFINNFFETVPNVFNQSIIMIKDLYDINDSELITEDGHKILDKMLSGQLEGTFYVNTVSGEQEKDNTITKYIRYK